jgi:uncharacterized membrane protein YfcA
LSAEILVAGIAIAFVAAACYSVTGFGFALVLTPILAIIWDVKPTIVASEILSTAGLIPLLLEARGHVPVGRVSVLFLASLAGIPIGVFLLERLDPNAIQIMVALTVIVASVLLYLSPNAAGGRDSTLGRLTAGFLGGALGSSTSMGGPPVVLYLLGRERDTAAFRATLIAFFLPGNIITLIAFALVGQVTKDVLVLSASALPAVALGLAFGIWLRPHVPAERFRMLVVAVLILSSFVVLSSTIRELG